MLAVMPVIVMIVTLIIVFRLAKWSAYRRK